MDRNEIIDGLNNLKNQLLEEVLNAFDSKGASYGNERFSSWKSRLRQFLDANLPGETSICDSKLNTYIYTIRRNETEAQSFWRNKGESVFSYIESLIEDIKNDEYELREISNLEKKSNTNLSTENPNKIFIVHGHDELLKIETARFIEKLDYNAVILHEQANQGQTIIEKIESYSDVGFAIVLYTSDDKGNEKSKAESNNLNDRARQNVIFEHGYLIGKLGRNRVISLVKDKHIELPSDISGIVYISDSNWQVDIAKEMKAAGYKIDFNKLL